MLSSSASGIVFTVPKATTLSAMVPTAAKPPADFSGPNLLNGSLGPGNVDISQNGYEVSVELRFSQHPEYNGLTLAGMVKGRKLVAMFKEITMASAVPSSKPKWPKTATLSVGSCLILPPEIIGGRNSCSIGMLVSAV